MAHDHLTVADVLGMHNVLMQRYGGAPGVRDAGALVGLTGGVAAIVGAAVGALHGPEAFPRRWVDGLLGRTGEGDDQRVFGLLDAALPRFLRRRP